eukprot:CAMPEP_0180284710 /NCGR_PEP_ID=MMETSP0988-20121125/11408_1 /TAXON_ID=697907 /ORGANISM="non described non described, Strain CCMP2293" /LENGTH=79 /DNA_ID=CAMNT_0022257835 /DNA_START=803 /DNA_END=1038 /DNA_ORIENTATION=-
MSSCPRLHSKNILRSTMQDSGSAGSLTHSAALPPRSAHSVVLMHCISLSLTLAQLFDISRNAGPAPLYPGSTLRRGAFG